MRKSEINSNLVIGFDVEKNVYEFSLRRNERVVVVFSVNRADFSGDEVYDGIGRAVVAFFDMLHEKDVFVRTEKSLLTLDEIKLIVGRLTFESDLSEIRAVNDICGGR